MENINEHDKTKEMMSIIRDGFKKKLMVEDTSEDGDDSIDIEEGSGEYREALGLLSSINPMVRITRFKVYPNDYNVILDATYFFKEGTDKGIHVKFDFSDDVETSMSDMELNSDTNFVLNSMSGLYSKFRGQWAKELPDLIKRYT